MGMMTNRRLLAGLWGMLLSASAATAGAATLQAMNVDRPEGQRHVLVAEPSRELPGTRPLVVLLHGHGGSAAQLLGQQRSAAPMSLWLSIADREGWLIAAPDGIKGRDGRPGWNDCRRDADNNPTSDDVGLIVALMDRLVAERRADPRRLYVMGMSNGGMMAFRLALELGPRLAAFATIGASMATVTDCKAPSHPLSALIVSGTADPLVPFGGGPVRFENRAPRGSVMGVEQAAARWRSADGLPDVPVRDETLPHRDAADPTRARRLVWGADPAKPQVELLRIEHGGHVEPSTSQRIHRLYAAIVGPQNGDVEVAEEAFVFFKDKQAPAPTR